MSFIKIKTFLLPGLLSSAAFAADVAVHSSEGGIENVGSSTVTSEESAINATSGYTPLMSAVYYNDIGQVQDLIEKGANLDTVSDYGTALTLAAEYGYGEIAKLLIEKGADVNAKCSDGTPLDLTKEKIKEYSELSELFVELSKLLEARNAIRSKG